MNTVKILIISLYLLSNNPAYAIDKDSLDNPKYINTEKFNRRLSAKKIYHAKRSYEINKRMLQKNQQRLLNTIAIK